MTMAVAAVAVSLVAMIVVETIVPVGGGFLLTITLGG